MSGYLRGLFDYLKARNAPIEPILDVMNLTEREALEPDRPIENSLQNEIFDAAERVTGDVNVGLHAGEATHLMHFGIAGMLAMTCSTGRELFDMHSRYSGLLSTGATMRYFVEGEELVGEATFAPGEENLSRHTLEYTLASHLTLTRLMTGLPFSPSRLEVPYPEPADCAEQQRVFGCSVRYGCERERIYMLAVLLDIPLVVGDSASRAMLEIEARRRLDALRTPQIDQDPDMASLRQFVAAELRGGPSSVEQAAAALGVSVRTLQRRLELRQLSYRGLVDLVRRELAQKYMADKDLSQVDVAYLLGFSDQSAFHRAFRRWFSTTPGEYRSRTTPPKQL
jgi:AraC-like DNA-binding protein